MNHKELYRLMCIFKRICRMGIVLSMPFIGVMNEKSALASPTINTEVEENVSNKILDKVTASHPDYRQIAQFNDLINSTWIFKRFAIETSSDPNFEEVKEYTLEIKLNWETEEISSNESSKVLNTVNVSK